MINRHPIVRAHSFQVKNENELSLDVWYMDESIKMLLEFKFICYITLFFMKTT
jgi:hypothetical protein